MIYTLSCILLILYLWNQSRQHEDQDISVESRNLWIVYSVLMLFAALRYITPGTDIEGYVADYNGIFNMSFAEIGERWESYKGYFWLSKVFSYTGLPYHFWLGFVAFLFLVSIARLLNRFSKDSLMALFILYTCGLYVFSYHGLKQVVAMAFAWNAFVDFYDKRFWRAGVFFFIAYLCHKSSLIFVFAFILWLVRNSKRIYYYIAVICASFIAFSSSLLSFMANVLEDEHYLSYFGEDTGYNLTTFIFYLGLFCAGLLTEDKNKETAESRYVISIAALSTFTQLFALVVASAFRLGYYFTPFLCIMTANNIKNNKAVRTSVIIVSAVFMLYSGRHFPYKFFWQ